MWALAINYFNRAYGFSNSFYFQSGLLFLSALRGPWVYVVGDDEGERATAVTDGAAVGAHDGGGSGLAELDGGGGGGGGSMPSNSGYGDAPRSLEKLAALELVTLGEEKEEEEKEEEREMEGKMEEGDEGRGRRGSVVVVVSVQESVRSGSDEGFSFSSIADIVSAAAAAPVSLLLYLSATINFGVSATILSMLGVLAARATPTTLSPAEFKSASNSLSGLLVIVFIASQAIGRLGVTLFSWHPLLRQWSHVAMPVLGTVGFSSLLSQLFS